MDENSSIAQVCSRCGKALSITDTRDLIPGINALLCKNCSDRLTTQLIQVTHEFVGISKVEEGVRLILEGLHDEYGLDTADENFRDTPRRVARAYAEIFKGVKNTDEQIKSILGSSFNSSSKNMVVVRNIRAYSMCPHHLLPVEYDLSIGYIPNGKVLGLSKLARVATILARRPVIQEQFTEDIADRLYEGISPLGVGVWVEGVHYCMRMRGAKQPHSATVTSSIRGCFEEPKVKSEFLNLVTGENK